MSPHPPAPKGSNKAPLGCCHAAGSSCLLPSNDGEDWFHFAPCFNETKPVTEQVFGDSAVPIWDGYERGFVRTPACSASRAASPTTSSRHRRPASGLFPRQRREYARTVDGAPLALGHLAATVHGKGALMPPPMLDGRFFHCEYHGKLAKHEQKRANRRTYDYLVFYGGP